MDRKHIRRLLTSSLTAAVVAASVFGGSASAANTRLIFIGSGTSEGSLSFTPTAPGGLTAVDVTVKNTGGQTINAVKLLGGAAADAAPVNPLFPAPSPPSLPSGAKYVTSFPSCDIPADGSSLTCNIGSLRKNSGVTYRVIIQAPASTGTFSTWLGAYVAEGNATGTNQDNFYAQGTFTAATAACAPGQNTNSNYFLPGSLVDLDSAACQNTGQKQDASINSGRSLTGQGAFASITVEDSFTATCPTGLTCFGNTIAVSALDGAPVPGGLQWSVTWYGTKSLAGVIHYLDGGGYDLIPFTKKFQCSAKLTTNCWVTTAGSNGSATPLWFSATFITAGNGKGGGYF